MAQQEICEFEQLAYKLSKIYFLLSDKTSNSIYQTIIRRLIIHYHRGNEFKKVSVLDSWYDFWKSESTNATEAKQRVTWSYYFLVIIYKSN